MWRFIFIGLLVQSVVCANGQSASTPPSVDPAAPAQTNPVMLKIGPGDLLDLQVFNTPELSTQVRVSQDGLINVPDAGSVLVVGLTPVQASKAIEANLREAGVMLEPHVTVFVKEYASQQITVLGEVKKPGTYQLLGQHSLYEALSAAGGVTDQQGSTIAITHQDDPTHTETVPVSSPNYSQLQRRTTIKAGDTVVVSREESIYVVGDVAHPGEFFIRSGQHLTVLNAIALAQGLNPTAKTSKVSIIRRSGDGAITIPVNLSHLDDTTEIMRLLRPDDVLVVPRSGAKSFMSVALPGITGAVAGSVAAALILH